MSSTRGTPINCGSSDGFQTFPIAFSLGQSGSIVVTADSKALGPRTARGMLGGQHVVPPTTSICPLAHDGMFVACAYRRFYKKLPESRPRQYSFARVGVANPLNGSASLPVYAFGMNMFYVAANNHNFDPSVVK